MDESWGPKGHLILGAVFMAIVVFGVLDVATDEVDALSVHLVTELIIIGLSLGLGLFLWRQWFRTGRSLERAQRVLAEHVAERDQWKRDAERALRDLGMAIESQFRKWNLTPAECEVALMLLQGYSHKEIAARTNRSDRTVRQHSVSVYRKSGLDGRAGLSAFFLQGLQLPGSEGLLEEAERQNE